MVLLPGELISALTFPGVICHEYAHVLACRWRGIHVMDVEYFRPGKSPAGYVRHQTPTQHRDAFWLATAPFFVNTIAAITAAVLTVGSLAAIPETAEGWALGLGLWLAISLGMHAFPSPQDAGTLWNLSKYEWRRSLFAALTIPVVVVIYVGHYLSYVYLDLIYGLGVVLATLSVLESLASASLPALAF